MMKAIRLTAAGAPLEEQNIPVPAIGPGDILVRVKAAGICHSDAHYRAGTSPVAFVPITLGHEIAGTVEQVGEGVDSPQLGDRVCLHYLVSCGACPACAAGAEQFCQQGRMLGKHRDGGFAEFIAVPARNAVPLPAEIPFDQGAILMCSSATSFHALRKARLSAGETVAIFGAGGLGMSAVQLARAAGALDVYAVDINPAKLRIAESYGAIAINAAEHDPVPAIRSATSGRGVDVALELIGLPQTMAQAVQSLAVFGRAVLVGISDKPFEVASYTDLIGREAEVIGCSDHLLQELPILLQFVRRRRLDLSQVITQRVPLEAAAINAALDGLSRYGSEVRTVVVP